MKTFIRSLLLPIFFLVFLQNSYGYTSYTINGLSLYYGTTYRLDKTYRHSFSVDNWKLNGGCGSLYSYKGFGSSFEWTDKSNYQIELRYFRSPQRFLRFTGSIFYLGIAPTVFRL